MIYQNVNLDNVFANF